MEPWEGPPVPRVNTLFELSFKIAAMLCDYFVRRTFTSHLFGEVVIWHYRQFLLAHHSLQHDFGWPEKLSFWLLPRLPTKHSWPHRYPPEIFDHVCYDHRSSNYQQYLSLR